MSISLSNPDWRTYDNATMAKPQTGIHLWKILTSDEHETFLTSYELQRVEGIQNDEVRLSYISSQGGIRRLLALYLQSSPSEVKILREERGKPFVAGGPHFNISHSAGRVFAAFSDAPVGLDVENLARKVSVEALADKFFFEDERAHIQSAEKRERKHLFLRYWVCKEASVKLSGDGIYYGLRDAHIILSDGSRAHGHYRGKKLWFREFAPAEGMIGAVASWKPIELEVFHQIGETANANKDVI